MNAAPHFPQGVPGLTRDLAPLRNDRPGGAPGQARGALAPEGRGAR